MKYHTVLVILVSVILLLPSVNAIQIFGDTDVYTFYNDEELFNKTRPGIVGVLPEIIYWRFGQVQGESDVVYLEMFLFWAHQYHYIADHDFDWEWYCVKLDSNGYAIESAFPEWHYIIGREVSPRLYNETHSFINIGPDNHPVTIYENNTFGSSITNALNYSEIDVEYIDGSILKRAAEEVGFDEDLFTDPAIFFEKGWFGYKRFSAFRDWKRSFMVYIDRKLDWVDFSD